MWFYGRSYHFDAAKISPRRCRGLVPETNAQLLCEWQPLKSKLKLRAPELFRQSHRIGTPDAPPFFRIIPGEVGDWERK